MRRFALTLTIVVLLGCVSNRALSASDEEKMREYSATAITLSDFSMKIVGYYQAQKLSVPKDFDTKQFFDVLEKIYSDQSRVKHIHESYKVSVRPLDGGFYSVMLCDPKTDVKIMEDLSCHLNRVEIKSWENNAGAQCIFEINWKPYCE
ncbi:MAG: hypothetical protein ACLP9S_02675 [Syntrophales bacterium]